MKTILIDSNFRTDKSQQTHKFQYRLKEEIHVKKYIQLYYVYIPFTQYTIRNNYDEVDNEDSNYRFQIKCDQDQDIYTIVLPNQQYHTASELALFIQDRLHDNTVYNNVMVEYNIKTNKLLFRYNNSITGLQFQNVDQGDIHSVLGFGDQRNQWFQLDQRNETQFQLNINTTPYISLYIPEMNQNYLQQDHDEQLLQTFVIPVTANRQQIIQQFNDEDNQKIFLNQKLKKVSINLFFDDNIQFNINNSRIVLILKYE